MKKRMIVMVLVIAMVISMLSGCKSKETNNSEETSDTIATSVPDASNNNTSDTESSGTAKIDPTDDSLPVMDVKIAYLQGFTQSDSEIEKWMEDRYNINITTDILTWSDGQSKISLLMGDEKQRPDIIWWWGMDSDYQKWVNAGLLTDVTQYMNTYTNMRDYYNKMDEKTLFFSQTDDGKNYRIPGDVSEPSCECLWIRQDWLDNLGLQVPKTLDELNNVLYAFTNDDPDGNGKDDTYGLGGDGYDFRSFWPWIQGSGEGVGLYDQFAIKSDGSYVYGPATDDAKTWLGRVSKLYADGVITPNITQDTDRDEEFAKGKFGVCYSWDAMNNPTYNAMVSFYSSNPDAKWVPIDMVSGDNADPQDEPATAAAWCYFGITNVCDDPERLYAIWDDMASEENYIHRRFGVEGEHWKKEADGSYTILVSNSGDENNEKNIGLKIFDGLFNRKDECNLDNTPATTALFKHSAENSRNAYARMIEKKDPNAYPLFLAASTDIKDVKDQYLWGVIAGTRSLDEWDSYLEQLDALGMQDILAELKDVYSSQNESMETYLSSK